MKFTLSFFSIALLIPFFCGAQVFQRLDAPVTANDTPLLSPWTGGINNPQWSAVELNGDDKPDLYAFDREGHVQLAFINEGESGEIKYHFAPEYLANFPKMRDYVFLRDYNQDGLMDIFAFAGDEGVPGFKVFDGYSDGGELKFERKTFGHFPIDILTVPLSNGVSFTNLNVSRPDYPSIEDMDGDGDLDILALFSTTGFSLVYYKNMAIEQGFSLDTLIYETEETCWGGIYIPTLTTSLTLSCQPDSCGNSCPAFGPGPVAEDRGVRHGASTILAHDFDGDGDSDVLYGDLQYPHITYLENDNSSGTDWVTSQDTLYPTYNLSVLLNDFPASFKIDIDNDGVLEFLFSPNTSSNQIRDVDNVFFYENNGTNEIPDLTKMNENILERDMIDHGSVSQPAFFDENGDGLMDFVVGNHYEVSQSSTPNYSYISLYRNVGTADAPAFELVDDDYLEFSQFNTVSGHYAPGFGDLDNDGDIDMLVGDVEGKLFYVQNNGGPGNPVNFSAPQYNWQFIDATQSVVPFIYDLNEDDLPDLLLGNKNGTIMYFPNIGSVGTPAFEPDFNAAPNNKQLGGITTQDQSLTASGFSAPAVLELGDTTVIITGGESGAMEAYVFDPEKIGVGETFFRLSENFANFYDGEYSRFAFANLNDDDNLEMLAGNRRGGLGLFSTPFTLGGLLYNSTAENINELEFNVFPNPADDVLNISLKNERLSQSSFRLFNSLGQTFESGMIIGERHQLSIGHLAPGVYFMEIKTEEKSGVKKVILK